MSTSRVRNVPGFPDLAGEEAQEKAALETALFDYIGLAGYAPIETPLLENADLFLLKSGGELASRMYAFTDPGGRHVALRPEFTASVIRAYVERSAALAGPVRWRYRGPVFRYMPEAPAAPFQRTQVGAEVIGRGDTLADVEVLALACGALRTAGITDVTLALGHPGIMQRMLEGFGLSDRAVHFIMLNAAALEDPTRGIGWVRAQAQEAGLVRNGSAASPLAGMAAEDVRTILHQVLTSLGTVAGGGRSLKDIEERFVGRLQTADSLEKIERALEFAAKLSALKGEARSVLERASALARTYGLETGHLSALTEILDVATPDVLGTRRVMVDLGLVRGLAYYTGMVFEIRAGNETGAPLCGGGRYDDLVSALGGQDTPALGFAFDAENALAALQGQGLPGKAGSAPQPQTVSAVGGMSASETVRAAVRQWDAGIPAILSPTVTRS